MKLNNPTIIIPTLWMEHTRFSIESLKNVPFPFRLIIESKEKSWAKSVNRAIRACAGDVILMDDDVMILPETFDLARYHMETLPDMFGFVLTFPTGMVQNAGATFGDENVDVLLRGQTWDNQFTEPKVVDHVSTSLAYIRRETLDKVGLFDEDFPGMQFEDVDFSFRMRNKDLVSVCLPNVALHLESATKIALADRNKVEFAAERRKARKEILRRYMSYEPI